MRQKLVQLCANLSNRVVDQCVCTFRVHLLGQDIVGSANGNNSLPIIYPCHRVIASNGGLGGYSGGLQLKSTLLELEARN
jgi:hypothetical protein